MFYVGVKCVEFKEVVSHRKNSGRPGSEPGPSRIPPVPPPHLALPLAGLLIMNAPLNLMDRQCSAGVQWRHSPMEKVLGVNLGTRVEI